MRYISLIVAVLGASACAEQGSPSEPPPYYAGPTRVRLSAAEEYCRDTGGRLAGSLEHLQELFEVCRDAYPDPWQEGPKYCWTGVTLVRGPELSTAPMLIAPVGAVYPDDFADRVAIPLCVPR